MIPWLHREKRFANKSEVSLMPDIGLILSKNNVLPGDLFQISPKEILLSFPADMVHELIPDKEVKLKLKDLIVDAKTIEVKTEKDKKLCQFKYINSRGLPRHLFQSVFNRRQEFRVKPEDPIPVNIAIHSDTCIHGRIIDISINGIGLEINCEGDSELSARSTLSLSFQLPDHERLFEIKGFIVNKRFVDGNIRCGIKFDWGNTKDSSKQEMFISSYVINRQRIILQKQAFKK